MKKSIEELHNIDEKFSPTLGSVSSAKVETYTTFDEYFKDCVEISFKKVESGQANSWTRVCKLGEEFGEFCEAMLVHNGLSQHKNLKEGIFGEGADIINCVVAALVAACPRHKPEEIIEELKRELKRKLTKYGNRIKSKSQND
jgi:hypothetical protein